MYNAITREIEPELVPRCRKYGIRLVIYNPLAYVPCLCQFSHHYSQSRSGSGGFFAGKVSPVKEQALEDGRFDPTSSMGKMYRARYPREGYFGALELLQGVAVRFFVSIKATAPKKHDDISRKNTTCALPRLR